MSTSATNGFMVKLSQYLNASPGSCTKIVPKNWEFINKCDKDMTVR